MLQWVWECNIFSRHWFRFLDIYPEVVLIDHMVVLSLRNLHTVFPSGCTNSYSPKQWSGLDELAGKSEWVSRRETGRQQHEQRQRSEGQPPGPSRRLGSDRLTRGEFWWLWNTDRGVWSVEIGSSGRPLTLEKPLHPRPETAIGSFAFLLTKFQSMLQLSKLPAKTHLKSGRKVHTNQWTESNNGLISTPEKSSLVYVKKLHSSFFSELITFRRRQGAVYWWSDF